MNKREVTLCLWSGLALLLVGAVWLKDSSWFNLFAFLGSACLCALHLIIKNRH